MGVTFSEAARQLGYKSRASLYRLRDSGRLKGYLTPDGLLELAPKGLQPLADHLAAVLQPQRRAEDRGQLEAELAGERARKLRIENDTREGLLVEVAALQPVLFRAARAARDHFMRLPKQMAHTAVAMGLPPESRFELEQQWEEVVNAALDEYSRCPIPESPPAPAFEWEEPTTPQSRRGL
jgi:hypothetical protein